VAPAPQVWPPAATHSPLHAAVVMAGDPPNRPGGHRAHSAAEPCRLYVPAGHGKALGAVAPSVHAWPAAQGPVQVAEEAPAEDPKRPTGQGLHAAPAPPALNLPGGHGAGLATTDPAGQAWPGAQGPEQAGEARPVVAPKVPAGQGLHTPAAPALNLPAGQGRAVPEVDPGGHAWPGGHTPGHTPATGAPVGEKVPGGHRVTRDASRLEPLDPGPTAMYLMVRKPGVKRGRGRGRGRRVKDGDGGGGGERSPTTKQRHTHVHWGTGALASRSGPAPLQPAPAPTAHHPQHT
jgi:hypothetical protein